MNGVGEWGDGEESGQGGGGSGGHETSGSAVENKQGWSGGGRQEWGQMEQVGAAVVTWAQDESHGGHVTGGHPRPGRSAACAVEPTDRHGLCEASLIRAGMT